MSTIPPQVDAMKKACAAYENRGILDKFMISFKETKSNYEVCPWDIPAPGFSSSDVYREWVKPWQQLVITTVMSAFAKKKGNDYAEVSNSWAPSCRKFNIHMMWMGVDPKDKTATFMLWFTRNERYIRCTNCKACGESTGHVEDVSGDPV
jgi:hypothetical protein